jgi:hypothetical protein
MIRDVADFLRTGVAGRPVADLAMPVDAWRATMGQVARRNGARVRTVIVPSTAESGSQVGRMVFAIRVDPPPDPVAGRGGNVRWWRLADLRMPFSRWRTALHRTARREHAWVHTFLVPPRSADDVDAPDQLVYLVWVDAEPVVPASVVPGPPAHRSEEGRSVTDLGRYASARRHPSAGRWGGIDGTER